MEEIFEYLPAIAEGLDFTAEQFVADFKNGDEPKPKEEIKKLLTEKLSAKVKAANERQKVIGGDQKERAFYKAFRDSGFEIPQGAKGVEVVGAFVEWAKEQTQHVEGDPKGMSKEELLKVPAVQAIVKEVKSKEAEHFAVEKSEWEKKVKAAENTRKSLLLDKTLLQVLEKGKINLGETQETKAVRLDFLKSRVPLDRVEIGDDGNLKFLDKDGYETDFEKDFLPVAQTAFGVVTQDKNRGGSGAQGSGAGGNGAGGTKVTIAAGTSQKDFDAQFMAAKPEDRASLMKAWMEQKTAAGN